MRLVILVQPPLEKGRGVEGNGAKPHLREAAEGCLVICVRSWRSQLLGPLLWGLERKDQAPVVF